MRITGTLPGFSATSDLDLRPDLDRAVGGRLKYSAALPALRARVQLLQPINRAEYPCGAGVLSTARDQFEFWFDAGQRLEIAVVVQQGRFVFNAELRDQAIMRAAWRKPLPAAAGVQRGGCDVSRGVAFGFERGKRSEVGAQPFEVFR